jgi:glycosyltransferase involved in cell wall biosynthesis
LAAWLAGTPIVVHTVHGWGFHDHMAGWLRNLSIALERLLAPLCDKLIVVSISDRDKGLSAAIGAPEQYTLIRSGIELERFGHPTVSPDEMRSRLGLPLQSLIVGSVTRLSDQKAPLDLVHMFARVAAQAPDAILVIVGDGPLRPQVEALIRELGLAGRVRLLGLRRDVPEVMGCFDLFVLTSLWEGLPRVLPQAMISGLAVVATGVDGSAEIVQHGITGYLCPPGQPEQMANRCIELLHQPALRRSMGQAGQQAVSGFGAKQMVAEIEDLYRALLAQKTVNTRQQTIRLPFVRS